MANSERDALRWLLSEVTARLRDAESKQDGAVGFTRFSYHQGRIDSWKEILRLVDACLEEIEHTF